LLLRMVRPFQAWSLLATVNVNSFARIADEIAPDVGRND
jgi:hypothetical protein